MGTGSGFQLSAVKLPMLKKKGVIKPDADGYYELVVGGLNTYNNTKAWYYTLEGAKQLFGPNSILNQRIANGCLRAEVNHPKQMPGEKMETYITRMLETDLNNVCAHFKALWLDEHYGKNNPELGDPSLVAIMGLVKPVEPKGFILKSMLDNPAENVCFSIRALCDEFYQRGERLRILKEIIAIDLVNMGGIPIATKWDSPATESDTDATAIRLTQALLRKVAQMDPTTHSLAVESSRGLLQHLVHKHEIVKAPPIYTRWQA